MWAPLPSTPWRWVESWYQRKEPCEHYLIMVRFSLVYLIIVKVWFDLVYVAFSLSVIKEPTHPSTIK